MAIILPELPYAYDALEPHIDAETMTLHHDKHHATYVANANAALEKHPEIGEDLESLLADVEKIPADIRQALINNGGGHLNHALFWELLSAEKSEISPELAADIDATFGSFVELLLRIARFLIFMMISVTSSLTPGTEENSCSTPAMRIVLTA